MQHNDQINYSEQQIISKENLIKSFILLNIFLVGLGHDLFVGMLLIKDQLTGQHYELIASILTKIVEFIKFVMVSQRNNKGQIDKDLIQHYISLTKGSLKIIFKRLEQFHQAQNYIMNIQSTIDGLKILEQFKSTSSNATQFDDNLFNLILAVIGFYITPFKDQGMDTFQNKESKFMTLLNSELIVSQINRSIMALKAVDIPLNDDQLAKFIHKFILRVDMITDTLNDIIDLESRSVIFYTINMLLEFLRSSYKIKIQNLVLNQTKNQDATSNYSHSQGTLVQILYKKLLIIIADCFIKLDRLEQVLDFVEEASGFIHQGDKDEIKLYIIALKYNCQAGINNADSCHELLHLFNKIIDNQFYQQEIGLECFNYLVISNQTDVAIIIGQNMLKTCDKVMIDLHQQKNFLLKFLYVFENYISEGSLEQYMPDNNQEQAPDKIFIQELLKCLVDSLSKIISLEFLKICSMPEIQIIFYQIWNVAFEAKQRQMYLECQLLLKSLYEQVRKFSKFYQESVQSGIMDNKFLSKSRKPGKADEGCNTQREEEVIQEILHRTLFLCCEINLVMKNYPAAKIAVKDMESISRNSANTYLMKIKVLFKQIQDQQFNPQYYTDCVKAMQEVSDTINQMNKSQDFNFVYLMNVINYADETEIKIEFYSQLIDYIIAFFDFNRQSILYSIEKDNLFQVDELDLEAETQDEKVEKPYKDSEDVLSKFNLLKFLTHSAQQASIINQIEENQLNEEAKVENVEMNGDEDKNEGINNGKKFKIDVQKFLEVSQRYIIPIKNYLKQYFYYDSQDYTQVEMREKLTLIIGYEEASYYASFYWMEYYKYTENMMADLKVLYMQHQDQLNDTYCSRTDELFFNDTDKIDDFLPFIEDSLMFSLIQEFYIESDIFELQTDNRQKDKKAFHSEQTLDKLIYENLLIKEKIMNSLLLIIMVQYQNFVVKKNGLEKDIYNLNQAVNFTRKKLFNIIGMLANHPIYKEASQSQMKLDGKIESSTIIKQDDKRVINVPVKQLKNKKLLKKINSIEEFCSHVESYMETMAFKLCIELHQDENQIDEMVNKMISIQHGKIYKTSSLKVVYVYLRENGLYPKNQSDIELQGFHEILSAHKDLIEISQNPQEKYILMMQACKYIEKANFSINLDFIKWMISLSWNQGIQLYKQAIKVEAINWMNFSINLLRKTQEQLQIRKQNPEQFFVDDNNHPSNLGNQSITKNKSNNSFESWKELESFLNLIANKIEDAHQKIIYEIC
ncbi:UNKNOWN [Stylonychia lemnae]|uniref:Uncharacterized protein n=1 Tax=Stylonychia lemnae TaxID=5949 RepID=A0A078BAB9_STYLE|nr:UNKNOWN [Stylonychia lemnae]|eukprot:CDW91181.1 UNKNOWN [Stylonychia lemnae]